MKALYVFFALLFATPSFAQEEPSKWQWTQTDTVLQLATSALIVVDWGQTRWFLLNTKNYELDPLLGPYPSRLRLDLTMAGSIVANALVARLLPRPYRRIWQVVSISLEAANVTRNAMILGMHWEFP